jgi:valyl-tRNA synthetase
MDVTVQLEAQNFSDAANTLYKFVWNVFCDRYLELVKPLLSGEDEAAKTETRHTAAWTLDRILMLLHPFMPFVTEELWGRLSEFGPKRERLLILETWPVLPITLIDEKAEQEIDWIIRLVSETRALRGVLNVPPGARIPLLLITEDRAVQSRLERYQDLIDRLARLEYSTSAADAPTGAVTFVLDEALVALPLEGVVDFELEAARLAKEVVRLESEVTKIDAKLANPDFVARAPEEVVEEQRERRADYADQVLKLRTAHARLDAALKAAP